MLQAVGPKPIIEPDQLSTTADWIMAGKAVFEQLDHITLRSHDPKIIALARSATAFPGAPLLRDGSVPALRWIPTERGVAIGFTNCSSCHMRLLPDGSVIHGPSPAGGASSGGSIASALLAAPHHIAASPVRLPEAPGVRSYRAYGVPWLKDDVHSNLKNMTPAEIEVLRRSGLSVRNGIFARWNGSPYFPAKIPDLIGVSDYKYLDHTGTHLNRGIGDLMRYIALVSVAESSDFGSHHMLTPEQRKVEHRLPDEAMYALALYIQSLKPPTNPNPFNEDAAAGKKVFEREGCNRCHTPPLYTNNKLTLAKGFTPPTDAPKLLDIVNVSVGTDPGLALKTRKGTGYYKVPSLRGVWYRNRYLHDGSLASLEEMFDPNRLNETFAPGGWNPPTAKARAVLGHEFGLRLSPDQRRLLIAFLRTL
jgi:mono/diheme cytochrome c family protein